MALSNLQTIALKTYCKPGMEVASFGYPDIIAPPEMVDEITGGKTLEHRKDSEAICKRHGIKSRLIPDAASFFDAIGCKLTVYDIVAERGSEVICDLNFPYHTEKRYGLLLDVGTTEHCFNVAQAIINMSDMVALGGHIIHENPFNWGNHGFYNINPTFFQDFYETNGFRTKQCMLARKNGECGAVSPTKRFVYTDAEVNVFFVAQRLKEVKARYPVQSKYAHLIPADAGIRA